MKMPDPRPDPMLASELFRLDSVVGWLDATDLRLKRAATEPPEPASSDSVNGETVMRLLPAACRRGVAAVVVTYDAQLAASWAGRVVFLRDGRIVDQTMRAFS
jgi:hypothetical protein